MNRAPFEALRPQPLEGLLDSTSVAILDKYDISGMDLNTVTGIDYSTPLADDDLGGQNLSVEFRPYDRSARVGFPVDGEEHGMYFRFKRGKLQRADRTTNGFQDCPPELEKWFRELLGEIKTGQHPDETVAFRFFTEEPQKLRF